MDVKASSFDAHNIMQEVNRLQHEPVSDTNVRHLLSMDDIPVVDAKWYVKDYLWNVGVHLGIRRDDYKVPPGLYRIGAPDDASDVLVTANYKYTFDLVRQQLKKDYWLLVIDTQGVNVWCAAGKGKFGTAEVIYWILETNLVEKVKHRRLILPQLAGPGVQGNLIKEQTGFHVIFGPVDIGDVDTYTHTYEKTKAMRTIEFPLWQRLKVTFVEWRKIITVLAVLALVSLYKPLTPFFQLMVLAGITGNLLVPITLPIRPFRKFYLNGILIQGLFLTAYFMMRGLHLMDLGAGLVSLAYAGYLAMNFTGSTTFTSLSGVKKEMEEALPILIILALVGMVVLAVGVIGRVL